MAGTAPDATALFELANATHVAFDVGGREITIQQVDTEGQAQRYVYPVFTTDGAIVIDSSLSTALRRI